MQVTVQLPDEVAAQVGGAADLPRRLLEAFAAESYRARQLSRRQVRELLGLDYWQTEDFLSRHEAKRAYTVADLEVDRRSLAGL
jgi:hypothetical protein